MTLHIGFTGTRHGMTAYQQWMLRLRLGCGCGTTHTFHHGDCVGADAEAHAIAMDLGYLIHVHPPLPRQYRAFLQGAIVEEPQRYGTRNQAIVAACEVLIAAPRTRQEEQRSGTWMTIRCARQRGVPVVMLWPDQEQSDAPHRG